MCIAHYDVLGTQTAHCIIKIGSIGLSIIYNQLILYYL